jgi:RimJ/RimL family protein N-acetyltransferase
MGPAYVFPERVVRPSTEAVSVTNENLDVLAGGFEGWIADVPHRRPFLAVLREGRAVSICCSVRITSESHEAGVETLDAYRGRGYASDVAARWANEVRASGCTPLYSTSRENLASQRVAKRLGLLRYGIDFHVT